MGAVCLLLALPACASRDAAAPPPVSSGPLAAITAAMDGQAVRARLGPPDDVRDYQTWRAWNPFHWESGTARTDWSYAGEGRVVFSRNRYSGRLSVIEVVGPAPGGD